MCLGFAPIANGTYCRFVFIFVFKVVLRALGVGDHEVAHGHLSGADEQWSCAWIRDCVLWTTDMHLP